jgi:uncharacterized membrane protein HdeD (DUF308 family)
MLGSGVIVVYFATHKSANMKDFLQKPSRIRTFLIGLIAGVLYALFAMVIMTSVHENVSISFIFVLPITLGVIPVLFSTKEQLNAYWVYLILPSAIVVTFALLSILLRLDGIICFIIIIGPFLLLGSLSAFFFQLLTSKKSKTPLYPMLILPFLMLSVESTFKTSDQFYIVKNSIEINAERNKVWENTKNVKNIQPSEISTHFVHVIGVPKPLNGAIDKEEIGGVREILWEKGIQFEEIIKSWDAGKSFTYDINVNPKSIPPTTLDEHVMIGGRYFDVLEGGYQLDSIAPRKMRLTLNCRYRVTTNLNWYSKWWADYILGDFNETILEIIKGRSELK